MTPELVPLLYAYLDVKVKYISNFICSYNPNRSEKFKRNGKIEVLNHYQLFPVQKIGANHSGMCALMDNGHS